MQLIFKQIKQLYSDDQIISNKNQIQNNSTPMITLK